MTLQEILFKNQSIPTASSSRSIRGLDMLGNIKCHDGKHSEKQTDHDGLKPNSRRVLNSLRRHRRPMTVDEVSHRLALSKSYCNNIMVNLYELGKAKRTKVGKVYEYEAVKVHGAS